MQNRRLILRIVLLALLLYALAGYASARCQLRRAERTVDALTMERDVLESEHAELECSASQTPTEEEMRQLARQRLGMVLPGERIFIFVAP